PAGGWVLSLAATDDTIYIGTNDNTLLALDLTSASERWRFDAGGTVWSTVPTAAALYVASTDGHLYAVEPANGNELWRFQTGDELETAAAIGDGRIFVGGPRSGALVALDPNNGTEAWRLAGSPFTTPPVVAQRLVFLGGDDDNLYAIDAVSGAIQWRFPTAGGASYQGPAVVDGIVYAPADRVGLYAIDAQSGEQLWLAEIPGEHLSSPAVVDGVVYVAGDYAGPLIALDAATGERLWSAPDNQARPAVADGAVYTKWAEVVYAHDATTGEQRWRAQPTRSSFSTDTIVAGDLVYAGDQDGIVVALDAASGDVRWTVAAGTWIEEIAAGEGILYAITNEGALIALDAASGAELWRSTRFQLVSSMAIAAGVLYAGGVDGDVAALDAATGAEIWQLRVRNGASIRWVGVAHNIVYAAGDGTLFAISNRQAPQPTGPPTTPLAALNRHDNA
ncbi:MAG: PQQ-binding-like beta-propeller repeat protein, partial [Thermomicrobiales bacterium]